jgi:hypothetical protein
VPGDVVSINKAEYTVSKGQLQVQASSTNTSATLQAYVTSTGELIGTLRNNGGGKYSLQVAWSTNPLNVTIKSSLGGTTSKSVAAK